jgi:hypothetical protein
MTLSVLQISRFLGFVSLLLLSSMIPFHHYIVDLGPIQLYREIFFILFSILFIYEFLLHGPVHMKKLRLDVMAFVTFPFLLFLAALYDPLIDLYGYGDSLGGITNVAVDPRVYVIRNAILYLPMVLYFYFRSISVQEMRFLALSIACIGPFSILAYLLYALKTGGGFGLFLLGDMAESGGANIAYNSYVPYLCFAVLASIYVLFSKPSVFIKSIVISAASITMIFIFLSSSRQTLLYCIIIVLIFLAIHSKQIITTLGTFVVLAVIGLSLFSFLTADRDLNKNLVDKYADAAKTSRVEIMLDGMERISLIGWFTGEGLTSVVNSGPHNDYIRWVQRVGVLFMVISFLPFFIGARVIFRRVWISTTHKSEELFIFSALFFVIYNSFFGYPREDAYQAFFCFLAMLLYLGFDPRSQRSQVSALTPQ